MAKLQLRRLAIVTATLNEKRAQPCLDSWADLAINDYRRHVVTNKYGVVPAFAMGVEAAIKEGAREILCLHDDVLIEQQDWDLPVLLALDQGVKFGEFAGGTTLGAENIYRIPYNPMQLARGGFVSNMRHAEAHGVRSTISQPLVCFDGFSQLGTADWFGQAWQDLVELGFRHHFYDGALGCLARRARIPYGWLIPIACHHYGGVTAVGSVDYQAWARTQHRDGDQGFWEESHRIGYEAFGDVLPLRLTR